MADLPSWFTDEITVVRASTTTDRYGDTAVDWGTATETAVTGCKVNPMAGGEDHGTYDDRTALTRRFVLAAPAGTDLRGGDRVRFDGAVYEVDGQPQTWKSPLGSVDHLRAELVRVDG